MTMLVGGFVLKSGFLSLVPLALTIAAGDLTGDVALYWLGRRYGKAFVARFGKYVSVTPEHVAKMENIFRKHHERIFLTTKATTGFGLTPALLTTAGMTRVPFLRFLATNASGEILRLAVYISIGFFFGNLYTSIGNGIELASFIVLIILFVAAAIGAGKYMKNRIFK